MCFYPCLLVQVFMDESVCMSVQTAKTISFSTCLNRWKGGRGIKLEGSDHAPVYMSLEEICDIPRHSTPPLSARYLPMIHGVQQTLGVTILFLMIVRITLFCSF
jgi:hypothetical protein